jgi:multiple antibiotic resistance protein
VSLQASLLYDFITLLAIINPIEAGATFATLTLGMGVAQQRRIAARASLTAIVILVAFGFIGEILLNALGVEFGAFRVAGGALLFSVGFGMVFAEPGTRKSVVDDGTDRDPTVFPLAIPIIAGPGALTTMVAIISKKGESPVEVAYVVALAVIVMVITFLTMRASESLTRVLGASGVNALGRVMGIIVAAISIQLVVDGLRELFPVLTR